MYIILAVALIAIAAYYPIKLIKFYSMESIEQGLKAKITQDLREGKVSRNLILLVLGDGGLRLTRNQLDVIFEWMLNHSDAWRVTSDRCFIVMFRESPFRPGCWNSLGDYKYMMRQMFGDHGTSDFLDRRCPIMESDRIRKNLKDLRTMEEAPQVAVYEYVRMMFGDEKVLAMVLKVNDNNEKLVSILSGTAKGQKYWTASNKAMEVISNYVAISELVRLKEEWKNKKREEAIAKRREELCEKYSNIRPGTYLIAQNSLYIVDSIDMEDGTAKCVRLVDLGINFPANEKCVLHLENGFRIATPEETAKILLKEYSNE